ASTAGRQRGRRRLLASAANSPLPEHSSGRSVSLAVEIASANLLSAWCRCPSLLATPKCSRGGPVVSRARRTQHRDYSGCIRLTQSRRSEHYRHQTSLSATEHSHCDLSLGDGGRAP